MEASKSISSGVIVLPQHLNNQPKPATVAVDKKPLVIEHSSELQTKTSDVYKAVDAAFLEKANTYSQTVERVYDAGTERFAKQAASYRSLELYRQKESLSEIIGVDVYA